MITIQIPINYVEVVCQASLCDTLGWEEEHGEPYPKRRHLGDDYNRAWTEAMLAISNARHTRNPRRGYTITVSTLAAQTLVDDMRFWATYPERTTITYAHARQCALTADRIESQMNQGMK